LGSASSFENTGAKRHPQGTNDFSMIFIRISNLFLYLFNLEMQTDAKAAQVYFKASKGPHLPLKTLVLLQSVKGTASPFENTGAKRHPQGTNDFSMIFKRISNIFPYLFNMKMQTDAKDAQVYFKASKGPQSPLKTMVQKDTPWAPMTCP